MPLFTTLAQALFPQQTMTQAVTALREGVVRGLQRGRNLLDEEGVQQAEEYREAQEAADDLSEEYDQELTEEEQLEMVKWRLEGLTKGLKHEEPSMWDHERSLPAGNHQETSAACIFEEMEEGQAFGNLTPGSTPACDEKRALELLY